jgi:hypothetical protein
VETKVVATDSDDKKFHDIAKPGKTPASSTSKPVIVTNRSMVKDPTLKSDDQVAAEPLVKSEAKIIAPPKDLETENTDEKQPKAAEEPDAPSEPKSTENAAEGTESNTDKDDEQIDVGRKQRQKEAALSEADKAKNEHIERLVASGRYAVPVGHIRRNKRLRSVFVIVLLLILLAFAAADLLIDAGVIKTDIQPVINLIDN